MSELWICHCSVSSWRDKDLWIEFFSKAQEILGYSLTYLDENDPIRRKVDKHKFQEISDYIIDFDDKSNSRELFGKANGNNISLHIYHTNKLLENGFPNSFDWYISEKIISTEEGIQKIKSLFDLGNELLSPFYSYSDFIDEAIKKKRKPNGAVSLQEELVGMFWLTYFNYKYVNFYSEEKIHSVAAYKNTKDDGNVTIQLTETPFSCSDEIRLNSEMKIGSQYFVDPSVYERKPEGKFAIKYSEL